MPKARNLALRKAVVATCRRMNELGINQGTSGNVSARIGNGFLISPSGVAYDTLRPEQVVEMGLVGGYLGEWKPSTEWRMHMDIFRTRPEAGGIIHVHANHATSLSCLRREIPAFHYMIGVTGGSSLRCAEYATYGTPELSENMLKALEDRRACLLANHGFICFAETLDAVLALAVEIETLCKQYVIARQVGQPCILDDEEMAVVLERFKGYGKQDMETDPLAPIRRG